MTRVCAVIVTYNRKNVLAVCLRSLLAQTRRVERILVVDNASTDGTGAWMNEEGFLSHPQVTYLPLAENRGGAGGFYEGFKTAYEDGADWIWAMDDDGRADEKALEHLLDAEEGGLFRGPLVLASGDSTENTLAFPYTRETESGSIFLHTRDQARELSRDGMLLDYIAPFNGVLVHREVVKRIGFPLPGFFMWGDEWDFVFRARKAGFPTNTVTAALFWHPMNRNEYRKIGIGRLQTYVQVANSSLGNYLLLRNYAYLASRHRGIVAWVRHTLKYLIYFSTNQRGVTAFEVLKYSLQGLGGRLRGHERFLSRPAG